MRPRWVLWLAVVPLLGQNKTPAGDWPMFNRDLAGTRYSPLAQITPANVGKLAQTWTYRLQGAGFRFATASGTSELTPIVTAGGLLFIGAATDGRLRAFDSKSGKELWAGRLERTGNAVPITYLGKNGKQYVAVTATDTLVVFSLP